MRAGRITLIVLLLVLLFGARSLASYAIEIQWWKELGQFNTWLSMLWYSVAPVVAATLLAFAVLWMAHARALRFAGTALREHRLYARISVAGAAVRRLPDRRFLHRYLDRGALRRLARPACRRHRLARFGLRQAALLLSLRSAVLHAAARLRAGAGDRLHSGVLGGGARLAIALPLAELREARELDPGIFRLEGGLESRFLRGAGVVLLLAMAVRFYLGRYEMVYNEHGSFLVGIDYVDQNIGLPLQWLLIVACLGRRGLCLCWAAGCWPAAWPSRWSVAFIAPRAVSALYVRPNEISLERPYIQTHIHATRSAFGLEQQVKEIEFKAQPDAPIDATKHKALLDNVRLWDWHAFHDTITQRQALRTYYVFHDSDVDRYTIDGQYRAGAALAARIGHPPAARCPRQLDQPGLHLHARLRPGAFRSQQDDARRLARAADSGCAAQNRDAQPEADAPRNLLRRSDARAGLRQHRAAGVQLSVRREERQLALRRQGRISHLVASPCGWPRPSARTSPTSCSPTTSPPTAA